jgi:hypothetical protein
MVATSATAARRKFEEQLARLKKEESELLADRAAKGWAETPAELPEILRLRNEAARLKQTLAAPAMVAAIAEGSVPGSRFERIGDSPVFLRGDYLKHGPIVPRRFPVILAGANQTPLGQRTTGSGRRELADWIAARDNPLTARVQVNRIWLWLFGEGLVRTPDNFGLLAEPPTHPELLDYLASRFVSTGWSTKRLVRELVLSSAYRQSSRGDPAAVRSDPENRLLGRANRKRLDHESIRDALLVVSGLLTGPQGAVGSRRTLYEPLERGRPDVARALFDGPDPLGLVAKRAVTTTAPQALYLMNNPFVARSAETLGRRMATDPALPDTAARVAHAFQLLFGRSPTTEEITIAAEYLKGRSWADLIEVLLWTNEFVYLD